jgi:glucose/arabinose dehydrogenase
VRRRSLAAAAVAIAAALVAGACSSDDADPKASPSAASTTTTTTTSTTTSGGTDLEVTTVASKLNTVWALKFDDKGKLWFTQRGGRLQQLGGPGRDIPGVVEQGEGGLMGLEIDAEGRIYLMLSADRDNRIVRLDSLTAEPKVLVDGIRKGAIHNGGRLRFSPDFTTLYAGTGDSGDTSLPPDRKSLNGKILAIDPGSGRARVYTSGHRNPQGLCFDDRDGRFLSTEHGPDKGDEINVIEEGKDYGWPDSTGDGIKNWTPTIAPAGCAVYDADLIPGWKGSMLFVTLKEQDLRRLTFAADGSVADEEVLFDGEYGRLRDVAVAPDGSVYVATSSRDSRGNPTDDDDRILRIAPATP